MILMSLDDFKAAIQNYCHAHNITFKQLGERIGEPRRTVSRWANEGIKTNNVRQRVVEKYPFLFSAEAQAGIVPPAPTAAPANREILLTVKVEQARPAVLCLSSVLTWFLFSASAEERNRFRDELGDDWQHILELTRAMTGEKAFEVTIREGRLSWPNQH